MLLKAPRPWVASPLGFNVLLSVLKGNTATATVEKYTQVAQLVDKEGCKVMNKLFISSSLRNDKQNLLDNIESKEVDFSKNGNVFTNYVNNFEHVRYHEFSSKTEFILTNISLFESGWQSKEGSSPVMKIYNSFNYTQDVKFEGRLLELPLRSEFKLVLVLPTECDVLGSLFDRLTKQGLSAAVKSIQPLFTAKPELPAPNFELEQSRVEVKENINAVSNGSAVQYGSIAVSDKGTRVKVVTCIYSPASPAVEMNEHNTQQCNTEPSPLYFAVVYDDTPVFIGAFNRG